MPPVVGFASLCFVCHLSLLYCRLVTGTLIIKKSYLNQICKKNKLRKVEVFLIDKDNSQLSIKVQNFHFKTKRLQYFP